MPSYNVDLLPLAIGGAVLSVVFYLRGPQIAAFNRRLRDEEPTSPPPGRTQTTWIPVAIFGLASMGAALSGFYLESDPPGTPRSEGFSANRWLVPLFMMGIAIWTVVRRKDTVRRSQKLLNRSAEAGKTASRLHEGLIVVLAAALFAIGAVLLWRGVTM